MKFTKMTVDNSYNNTGVAIISEEFIKILMTVR